MTRHGEAGNDDAGGNDEVEKFVLGDRREQLGANGKRILECCYCCSLLRLRAKVKLCATGETSLEKPSTHLPPPPPHNYLRTGLAQDAIPGFCA